VSYWKWKFKQTCFFFFTFFHRVQSFQVLIQLKGS
jgi:hypothetical protein